MTGILDASAMIAYLRREIGWDIVADLLADSNNTWFAHVMNLVEVFYDFYRGGGEQAAQIALQTLAAAGVRPRADMEDAFWQEVARLKAVHRRVSLADCFCIALARRLGGEVVTSDHHEFDRIVPLGLCVVRFIR